MGETERQRLRALPRALGVGLAAVVLWPVVAWVFSSDRGIGFRDEGLYLLAADPPSATARWVTPFGWHTAPFFHLLGDDVARLRTFAVWSLVLVGALLGWAVGRRLDSRSPLTRWTIAAVGALGAPFLASGFLRTPGYNWVNLVGLLVATAGAVLVVSVPLDAVSWRLPSTHVAVALLALGVWFTVPAKPTSAPLFLGAGAVFVAVHLRRRAWVVGALTAGWGLVFTALGVAIGWWPASFLTVLGRSAEFPALHENQTVPGALRDVLRTPKVAAHDLALLRPATAVLVVVAAALAIVGFRRPAVGPLVRLAPFALTAVGAVGTAVPWPLLGEPNPFVRFAWYGTTNAAVLLFVGALLHLLVHWRATVPAARRHALGIAGLCIATAFTFGFGSALSIYHQAALAAVLMWCATAAVLAVAGARPWRPVAMGLMVVASAAMSVSNVVDSRHHPFDIGDMAEQQTPVRLGAHGDELRVDPSTASYLARLQQTAHAAGYCPGTPLIGTVWGWTSTTAFAMGAEVPEHLILTIFGYPDAARVLDLTMHDLAGPRWHDAWVLTSDPDTIAAPRGDEVRSALDRLPAAIARTFPADYTMVAHADDTQLWRPTDVPGRASCS